MKAIDRTKKQLIDELSEMRQRVTELEASEAVLKQTQEKIQEHNEFLRKTLNSLAYPLYVIDAHDYSIRMANLAAKADNLSENTTCYALTYKSVKPCSGENHVCPLEEVKRTKKSVVVEHVHYNQGGSVKNVEVHGYPLLDAEGNVSR